MSRPLSIAIAVFLLCAPALVRAQEEDAPLGDLARAARKPKPLDNQPVIDNDNLHLMMDQAESQRLNGKPVFSIDPSGNTFRMTSPDGTCSLSFDARATALISSPFVSSELPQDALLKLEGPAAIHDGVLEVSLHNTSGWEVKEIVVGVTVLQSQTSAELKPMRLLTNADTEPAPRQPDITMLYHLKATSPPDAITVFRGDLGGDLDPGKEWHWALVGARGIPPAAPESVPDSAPTSLTSDVSPSETKPVFTVAPAPAPVLSANPANPPANVALPAANSGHSASQAIQH
jgi:hypothetical protein